MKRTKWVLTSVYPYSCHSGRVCGSVENAYQNMTVAAPGVNLPPTVGAADRIPPRGGPPRRMESAYLGALAGFGLPLAVAPASV